MNKEKHWNAFCALINTADEVRGGKSRSEAALSMMFRVLKEFDFRKVADAIEFHIRNSQYAITPSNIIENIEGKAEDRAALAWRTVIRAVENPRLGHYHSVRFPEPAYHFAIEQMGGWIRLCESLNNAEMPFRERDFIRFYSIGEKIMSWENTADRRAVAPYLCGFLEADNRSKGYEFPAVRDAITGNPLEGFREALGEGLPKAAAGLPEKAICSDIVEKMQAFPENKS